MSQTLALSSGVLLVGSAFGPWTSAGPGASLAGHELGDLLLGGTFEAWAPRWSGLGLYFVPFIGALVLTATGFGGRVARWGMPILIVVATLAFLVLGSVLEWRPLRDPAWGSLVTLVGIAAGSVASILGFRYAP